MDHALLVRVMDSIADRHEQAQALLGRRVFVFDIAVERDALGQFHRKERSGPPAIIPCAALKDLCNPRVLKPRGLARVSKAPRVNLDRDFSARVFLLGAVDGAHPAATQNADDPVLANTIRHRFLRWRGDSDRIIEQTIAVVLGKQRYDPCQKVRLLPAHLIEIDASLFRIEKACMLE